MLRPLLHLILAAVLNDYLFTVGEVRLANGLDICSGRVEVLHNSSWRTVCGDSWDINDAAVVCRQLGCGRAVTAHIQALFGEGSGQILNVNCQGMESSIIKCSPTLSESNNCFHSQDAGVVCSASLVVVIGAVSIAVVLLLSVTVIIILVMRRKKKKFEESQKCSRGAVNMLEVPHEEIGDEADYERVDVEGDHEDLNSDSEQDYVNIDEPKQSNVELDESEQDHVNVESDDSEQDYVNVESDDSEQDYVNVESNDSEQDYVNMEITKDIVVDNNYKDL